MFIQNSFGLHYCVFLLFQFVELKGSVFKKFDKNNLFQVSCSDVRERFHLFSLLFIVVVQTMKEYGWKEGKKLFLGTVQRYTYRVLQTIQTKLILLCVWAERAVLGSAKTALKFKFETSIG